MIDIADFARRIRRRSILAGLFFFGSAAMLIVDFTTSLPTQVEGEFAFLWLFGLAIGAFFYFLSMELPKKEILQLAETHNGLLSLSEISTALAIDPQTALRTLLLLQRLGIAIPRWQELQKNLWEFPDYLKLPIAETIDLAKKHGGRLSLKDLISAGHSVDVAQQTFDALSEKGLAQKDPSATGPALILETQ